MCVSKKSVIVIFLLFSVTGGFTQNMFKSLEDSIKANLYNNPKKSIKLLHQYIKLSEKNNNTEDLIPINATLAAAHEVMHEIDSSFYYHYKNLSIATKPIDIIYIKRNIARILAEEGKYRESLRLYYQVLELTKENNEKDFGNDVRVNIASLKSKIGKSNEPILIAKDEYKRLKERNTNDFNLRFTRKILIEAYIKNKNFKEALFLIGEGIDESKDINDCEFIYYMYFLRSQIRIINNELDLAKTDCEKALQCAEQLKNNDFINEIKFRKAEIAFLNKNFEEALKHLIFINESEVPKSTLQLTKYYELTADVYKKLNNNERSAEYYYLCLKEKEKLSDNKLSTLETLHNLDLNQEILEKEKQKKSRWMWTGVSILLLLVIITLFIVYKTKSKTNQLRFNELMLKVNALEKQKAQNKISNPPKNETEIQQRVKEHSVKESNKNEDSTYVIGDKKVREILRKVENLEDQNYFLRHDCTLQNMAKKLKTNTTYLSKIINTHLGKSFSNYITELRINYAIVALKNNKRLRSYSVKGIAEEMGYKNADIFSRYFKEATGITPAVFIKKIREIKKTENTSN